MIKVVLADDHDAIRKAIGRLLCETGDIEVLAETGNGLEAIALAATLRPDVAVLDFSLPDLNGLEVARRMSSRDPQCQAIIITAHDVSLLRAANPEAEFHMVLGKQDLLAQLAPAVRALGLRARASLATSLSETERQAVAHTYLALESPPGPGLDLIVASAARATNTPISMLTIVGRDRQWIKAAFGSTLRETPRHQSFCSHAIGKPAETMVVPDATTDVRFRANGLVTGEPWIRFYASVPIIASEGAALGTLCVIDTKPRSSLLASEKRRLNQLAGLAMINLEFASISKRRDGVERSSV